MIDKSNMKKKGTTSVSDKPQKAIKKTRRTNYFLFYLKDIGFGIILFAGLFYFINGSFYYGDNIKKFEKKYRIQMNSNKLTAQQKQKLKTDKAKNLKNIKMAWGYFFATNNLLLDNIKTINKRPDLDMASKVYSKSGTFSLLLHNLKLNTPESARIILPLTENELKNKDYTFIFNDKESKIKKGENVKKYMNWFLYPRKIIFNTPEDKKLLSTATHVYIFDSKGTEFVDSQLNPRVNNFGVYPAKKL